MKQLIQIFLGVAFLMTTVSNTYGQACPNGDFENWTSHGYDSPDSGWFSSNVRSLQIADTQTVWKVAGYSGQAVHIQTAIIGPDTLQAYVVNTDGDPKNGKGGVPYAQQPTAVTGYYRYNLPGNDSAGLWIVFKKAGVVISDNVIKFRGTGSISTFTAFSFPLPTLSVIPDSVIIAAASSNLFSNVGIESGSWLELDQLKFTTSVAQNIPGASFDNWLPMTFDRPDNWKVQGNGNGASPVAKSTTHYSGSYSVMLTTMAGGGDGGSVVSPGAITTGYVSEKSGPRGGLPYTGTTDTLTGYYMYTPVGTDTANIMINLSHTGSPVGGSGHFLFAASTWTYFEAPFTAFSTPDTLRIDAVSGSRTAATPGSVLYLDYLQLKSQPLPLVKVNNIADSKLSVYPNPAADMLHIRLNNGMEGVSVSIYDLTGRVIETKFYEQAPALISMPIGNLSSGMYFYEIKNQNTMQRNKFIKE